MRVLVIGSGGREHAITWKLNQSQRVEKLYCAPGNAGTLEIAENVNIKADDIKGLVAFAKNNQIDFTVVGPEVPLVLGVVDAFEAEGLKIFGPSKKAAQFEGSKAFSKDFMDRHSIPTAKYKEYTVLEEAKKDVESFGFPLVIKADGLAAGKGVVIAETKEVALEALDEMMGEKVFGDAGDKVVFEEFLTGIEASILCFVDGKTIKPMASAQDYKRAYDGDKGLNTGGMGAYSPSRLFTGDLEKHIDEKILQPFLSGTIKDDVEFKGVIFIGLMIENNEAKVIEFNCRMGDPETQVVLPRMKNDLLDVFEACTEGKLDQVDLDWIEERTVAIVLASGGYPGSYEKKKIIKGIDRVDTGIVFHVGTTVLNDDVVTNGGRVLNVLAYGNTIAEARSQAYENVKKIEFDQMMYRSDIANPQ